MNVTVTSPATVFDLAKLVGATNRLHWIVAKELWQKGDSWVIWHDETPLGLFCVTPFMFDRAVMEATFCATKDSHKHMLAIIRQIRLTLEDRAYSDLVTIVRSEAGKRIARLTGFVPHAHTEIGEVWEYGIVRRRRIERGKRSGAKANSIEPAA